MKDWDFDIFASIDKAEVKRKHHIDNGEAGAYGSGGSMRNPMYRQVHSKGTYHTNTMRKYRRQWKRDEEKNLRRQQKQTVSKFHKGFA